MKAFWGFVLVALVWFLVWFSTPASRLRPSPVGGGRRGKSNGPAQNVTFKREKDWDWPTFDQEVDDGELRIIANSEFSTRCHGVLGRRIRHGQADFRVSIPEKVAEHDDDLNKLVGEYRDKKGLTDREILEINLMFDNHELGEIITEDLPQFPLPEDVRERREFVKNWTPLTRGQERSRWVREWLAERPFFLYVVNVLPERERRIRTYLFDRFYLGQDRLAKIARNLHYLQPALSIWRRTRSEPARDMHYRRAAAVITDPDVLQHLMRVYRRNDGVE